MICIIVTCAVVVGTSTCDISRPASAHYIEAPAVIKDWTDCREAFRGAQKIAPGNGRRAMGFDYMRGK